MISRQQVLSCLHRIAPQENSKRLFLQILKPNYITANDNHCVQDSHAYNTVLQQFVLHMYTLFASANYLALYYIRLLFL
jgi:hypothetical protein